MNAHDIERAMREYLKVSPEWQTANAVLEERMIDMAVFNRLMYTANAVKQVGPPNFTIDSAWVSGESGELKLKLPVHGSVEYYSFVENGWHLDPVKEFGQLKLMKGARRRLSSDVCHP